MHKTSLIILVLICNCIFAQNKKLVIKHTDRNSRIVIKKEKYIGIWSDSVLINGVVVSFDSNYIKLRMWGRDKSKIEYFADRLTGVQAHRMENKEGWRISDSLTRIKNENDTLIQLWYLFSAKQARTYIVLQRSTDIEHFSINEIDSITAQKGEGNEGGGFGVIIWPLVMLSTPIWAYDDEGHYEWGALGVLAGLTAVSWSLVLSNNYYSKWRIYDFKVYKVDKIKPIHAKKIPCKGA
jgi:hypothetical protein